ncbi:hypothetical protein [Litoribacillus peritrichatus]|uniref:RRM domain-containing protein n=1 Tax=Litoribacillus peritrichatus TaxID=718191 RepID=A0ABP7M4E4_9GAMM
MFVRIDQVPNDVTEEEILDLFNHSPRVKHVIIKNELFNDDAVVWVRLNVESRAVINGIADYMNGKYLRSHKIRVSAPLFFNEPWVSD